MGEIRAIRGGKALTDEEYLAHLALAMRLENVGVLLGAGSSISAGGKILKDVWQHYCNTYKESVTWLKMNQFLPNENIEALLDRIHTAEQEWKRQNSNGRNLRKLRFHRNNLYRSLIQAAVLNKDCWKNPDYISNYSALYFHKQLLSRLVLGRRPGQPEPWVFTTNYDLAIEWAADSLGLHIINGFAGLHRRIFIPSNFELGFRNTQARGEARFGTYHIYLAKLHGSLTWTVGEVNSIYETTCKAIYPKIEAFLSDEEVEFPSLLIYPGASKYVHTSSFIYGELLRRFSEFLARPQTCLLVNGYSFGDEHINRILINALYNPTLHLILYAPEITEEQLESIIKDNISTQPHFLNLLLEIKSPQITIVGGGKKAHFDKLVNDLPEPVLLDNHTEQVLKLLKLFEKISEPLKTEAAIAATQEGEDE